MLVSGKSIIDLQEEAFSLPLYISLAVLSINNIAVGYSYYYAGITLPYHKNGEFGYIPLTDNESNWYLSLHPLTILLGSLFCNPLGECLGRKKALIFANMINVMSFAMMYVAPSFIVLLTGRLLSGFSTGIGILVPFVYLNEISTIKRRAGMANSANLFISFGTLTAYLLNMTFSPAYLPLPAIGFSILFIACTVCLPESPHWLIRKGRMLEAETVFRALRGDVYQGIDNEIKEVLNVLQQTSDKETVSRWTSRGFLMPMGILIFLFSTVGLCGLDAPFSLYGPRMFAEFGFHIPYQYIMLFIPTGSSLGYIIAIPLMERLRKRDNYMFAATVMALSTGFISLAYFMKDYFSHMPTAQLFMASGAIGVTFGYGVGLGSVVYALPGELLCPEDKTIGISIAHCFRMVWTAAIMKVYPLLLELLGYPVLFAFHTLVLLTSIVFVCRFLPETRNKSLNELSNLFAKNPPLLF